jgi:lysyl-tRNA synthetase, class II
MSDKSILSSDLAGQRSLRIEKVSKLRESGIDPYPSRSNKNISNAKISENFEDYESKEVFVAGRIRNFREHGGLIFWDLEDQTGKIQIYIKQDSLKDSEVTFESLNLLDVGDLVEVKGVVTKTFSGEVSVLAESIKILTKSIRPLPVSLEEKEERYRRRYLDMVIHPEVRERFKRRSKFWEATREFMNKNGFIEINIPILEHTTGGADANPFVTHYDALGQNFYLRISHELPLKRLLGAGFEKVYDIGARFRNEGFSDEHLPEHVAMEWYWAYADYKDGMQFTKELFRYVMNEVYGTLKFSIRGFEVDLSKEWEEIQYVDIIRERFGVDIFNTPVEEMNSILKKHGVELGENINRNRVVDNLWKLIRKTLAGPAFLVGVPKFMSPLAKTNTHNPLLTDRFHPIIAGSELANAFSELNDPQDQLERFVEQQRMRDEGDAEAQMLDIDYVEMLEYGMPPAVGYGHSERVFWFFEGVTAKEGVPFPQLKFEIDNTTRKIYGEEIIGMVENPSSNSHSSKKDNLVKGQDFSNRVVIVVNNDIEGWQKANAISHISAYLGHKLDERFATGENFITKDGKTHPRNSQYAIIIMTANPGQMHNLMERVRSEGLLYHGFIREMIETTDDQKIVEILSDKTDEEIEYLGIGFYGSNEKLKELTKKFSLFK